jgi:hypothetical protein
MASPTDINIATFDEGEEAENVLLAGKMLQLLVCPLTKQSLKYDKERQELVSLSARLAYPVRGGIPILLPSEARHLEEGDMAKKI